MYLLVVNGIMSYGYNVIDKSWPKSSLHRKKFNLTLRTVDNAFIPDFLKDW